MAGYKDLETFRNDLMEIKKIHKDVSASFEPFFKNIRLLHTKLNDMESNIGNTTLADTNEIDDALEWLIKAYDYIPDPNITRSDFLRIPVYVTNAFVIIRDAWNAMQGELGEKMYRKTLARQRALRRYRQNRRY